MSLIEMVIGMPVMAVFLAIFTGAIVTMTTTVNKVQAVTTSASQTNTAFMKLDKLVRYAIAITTRRVRAPATGTSSSTPSTRHDVETCTQLRVDITHQQLQHADLDGNRRHELHGLTAWTTLANEHHQRRGGRRLGRPTVHRPGRADRGSTGFQRLTITLVAAATARAPSTTDPVAVTFTALNSVAAATTNAPSASSRESA